MTFLDGLEGERYSEFRVREVTRYIVTRYDGVKHTNGTESGSSPRQLGNEFPSADTAYEVAYALARQEAEHRGLPPGSMGVIYPAHPREQAASPIYGTGPLTGIAA